MGRDKHIDNLRVLATLAVVLLHVTVVCYNFYCSQEPIIGTIFNCINVVCRFSVPLFVMITGFLLLQPSKVINYKDCVCKYAWRILVILLVVGTLYAWLELAFSYKTYSLSLLSDAFMNVFMGNLWDHMWYLYMLIGLYLILPMVKSAVSSLSTNELDILLIILFIFTLLIPSLQSYGLPNVGFDIPIKYPFLFYLLLGYRCSITRPELPHLPILIFIMCVIIISFLIVQNQSIAHWSVNHVNYTSPLIALLACSLFLIKSNHKRQILLVQRIGRVISKFSFGIYIFHPFWMNVLCKALHLNPMCYGVLSVVTFFMIIIVLSIATTWGIRRIPFVGRYI